MLSYAKLTNLWQLLERAHISPSQFCLFYEMKHIGGKLMSDVHPLNMQTTQVCATGRLDLLF